MMRVFDFDNTIYDGESMVDFFLFMVDKKEELSKYKGIVMKVLRLYELNLLPMTLVKNLISRYKDRFNFSTNNIDKYVDEFWKEHEHKLMNNMLKMLKKDDVIITASPNVLLDKIKHKLKTKNILCSIINVEKKEAEFICYKENKVIKYREVYKDTPIDELYTDSYADRPLMKLAKKVYMIDKKTKEIKCIKGE